MWIEDAARDIRFARNPLVTGDPNIRFYAGAPICVRGSKIGTLCVIDSVAKPWDERTAIQLEKLAKMVGDRIQARAQLRQHLAALDEAPRAIIQADEEGRVGVWNPAAESLLGLSASEAMGRSLRSLLTTSGEEALQDRQYRLLVAEVSDYAIYMLDPEGRVVSWNSGAERIKGYLPQEIIGSTFGRFYTEEDRRAALPQKALRVARATGRFEGEGWRVRKDGTRLWASVVIEPIHDEGVFVGFAKITRDVTPRHEADAALQEALRRAEQASESKSQFLANMSHEIRTPLNGVVAVADMLQRADLPPKEREMAGIIAGSAQNLERLLGDILDLARIEAGQITIAPEPFDLGEAVLAVTGLARPKAEEKGLAFRIEPPAEGASVVGDRLRLQQILSNLLSNAVKFTEHGAVELSVALAGKDEDGRGLFSFEVRDTGVGFDPERKDLVFGRFSQADGSITRRFGGTGLGMAISQQLARMMGGELDCQSAPGRGSVFTLTLPLAPCDSSQADAADDPPTASDPADRPIKILLADDHPTNRKVCELILSQIDTEVISVENGQEAVNAFLVSSFDVVLMDMQMPVMDGLTAVREIRRHEQRLGRVRTPIFMLTANALPEHVEQGRAAGADHHISKPITSAAVFSALSLLAEAPGPGTQLVAHAG